MIIGNGQLAQIFKNSHLDDTVIFASGVSNSNCQEKSEFLREKKLLLKTIKNNPNKKFIYFSSCALSADDYAKNEYYQHKLDMEELIKISTDNYYIFRLPQLFGELKEHKTLINFIYNSIVDEKPFNVYSDAYRYVIEIDDVRVLVESYLKYSESCITVDLANPFRYKIQDIVNVISTLVGKQANYTLIKKVDKYYLDLSNMNDFIKENHIKVSFGSKYLQDKLSKKI